MVAPPKKPYTGDELIDNLVRMNAELLSELWILRDRVTILEHMLQEKGVVDRAALNDYVPAGPLAEELQRQRDELVRKVIGGAWLQGFSLEGLVDSARTKEPA
jgi:hypothetical protein